MSPQTPESLLEQGRVEKRERRFEDARDLFRRAISESVGSDDLLRGTLLEELAYVERTLRELVLAQEHYLQAAEIYRGLDNPLKMAHTMRHAADILREQSKPDQAEPLYAEALQIYRGHKETPPLDLANAIRGSALLQEDTGNRDRALELWRQAGELYKLTGIEAGVSECNMRIRSLTDA